MVAEEVIREATRRLAEKFDPDRIILFGSYARGIFDECSDVDFMVITEAVNRQNRHKIMAEMDRVLWGLKIAKDIVALSPDEFKEEMDIPGTTARYASKEGRLVYERKSGHHQKAFKGMVAARG
jgi:predicted nucleotidyltransferase